MGTSSATTHAFQVAGLGTAPFRVVGYEKSKPGQSRTCEFCGRAISVVCKVKGSAFDDSVRHVGQDCVRKTGDAGLVEAVKCEEKAAKEPEWRLEKALASAATREAMKAAPGAVVYGSNLLDCARSLVAMGANVVKSNRRAMEAAIKAALAK